jgi:hypothetical protein
MTAGGPVAQRYYVLGPRGTDAGTRGLRITDPTTSEEYFVDFRNGAGRDAGAFYPTTDADYDQWFREGVTIEKASTDPDGDPVSLLQSYPQSDGEGRVYAKVAGETFEAGGVRVEVDALGRPGDASATAAVTVTLADGPAAPGAAFAPIPDACEAAPTPTPTPTPTVATGSQQPAPTATPTAGTTSRPPATDKPPAPAPTEQKRLPNTGSPRLLVPELLAAGVAIILGTVLLILARR